VCKRERVCVMCVRVSMCKRQMKCVCEREREREREREKVWLWVSVFQFTLCCLVETDMMAFHVFPPFLSVFGPYSPQSESLQREIDKVYGLLNQSTKGT